VNPKEKMITGHRAKVRVTLTLEHDVGTWSDDCTIAQLRDQARRSACEALAKLAEAAKGENLQVSETKLSEIIAVIVSEDGS